MRLEKVWTLFGISMLSVSSSISTFSYSCLLSILSYISSLSSDLHIDRVTIMENTSFWNLEKKTLTSQNEGLIKSPCLTRRSDQLIKPLFHNMIETPTSSVIPTSSSLLCSTSVEPTQCPMMHCLYCPSAMSVWAIYPKLCFSLFSSLRFCMECALSSWLGIYGISEDWTILITIGLILSPCVLHSQSSAIISYADRQRK